MADERALRRIVDATYSPADYPALDWQMQQWRVSRPLAGVRLLDATPAFRNTLVKYLPFVAGGAELTVSLSPLLPHSPDIIGWLTEAGIPVIAAGDATGEYDVIVDCAGLHAGTPSRAGHVELTKSGEAVYRTSPTPVILVDNSRIKLIETSLGTGDGFVRAMAHFGYQDLSGRSVVIFGCGKVGRGAALRSQAAGARVTVVDPDPHVRVPAGCALVDASNDAAVRATLASAWCLVSATGHAAALSALSDVLRDSDLVLANLGAEDEFGSDVPAERVLNGKAPVNFALAEPTQLRFIDATMALDNACAVELLHGGYARGIHPVPQHLEEQILTVVRSRGMIADDLATIDAELAGRPR